MEASTFFTILLVGLVVLISLIWWAVKPKKKTESVLSSEKQSGGIRYGEISSHMTRKYSTGHKSGRSGSSVNNDSGFTSGFVAGSSISDSGSCPSSDSSSSSSSSCGSSSCD